MSWLSGGRSDAQLGVKDNAVFAGLLLLLAWAPIPLGSNRALPVGILVVGAVGLVLACAWAWRGHATQAWQRLQMYRWPLGALALFAAWVWLQTANLPLAWVQALSPEATAVHSGVSARASLSVDVHQTLQYAALSVAYTCVFGVVALCVRDRQRLDRLAYWLVGVGVAQAVLAIALYSVKSKYFVFYTEVHHVTTLGTYVNRNHFAGLMELMLSVGVGLMLARLGESSSTDRSWKARTVRWLRFLLSGKMVLRLMLVVMVIALVLTRSRMGNTGFFAALLVVGAVTLLLTRRSAPAMVTLVASLVVVDILVVGTWVGLEKVVERVQGPQLGHDIDFRADAALHVYPLLADFGLTGTGGGTFYNAYVRYRTLLPGYFDHAHQDYLELAADFGWVGLALLGVLVLSTFWVSLLTMYRRRSALPRGMSFGVMMAIVAIAIHSTVDFNLQIPANALLTVVVLAMGWVAYSLPTNKRSATRYEGHT